MILFDKKRYGLNQLYLITHSNDDYRCNPSDAITTFISEVNASDDGAKALFWHDISTPGTYIDFTPSAYKASRDMTSIVHSVFPMVELADKNVDTMFSSEGKGALVEIPSSEAFFVIYKNEYSDFDIFPVLDFSGSLDKPTNIHVADKFNQAEEL